MLDTEDRIRNKGRVSDDLSYLGASVHGGESIRRQVASGTHREGVRHTEQRRHTEDLGQVCPETGEHEVGQQNILLYFPGEVIDSAGVGQVE